MIIKGSGGTSKNRNKRLKNEHKNTLQKHRENVFKEGLLQSKML